MPEGDKIISKGLGDVKMWTNDGVANYGKTGALAAKFGNTNFGDSRYDNDNLPSSYFTPDQLEKIRGDRQSWGSELANAIGGGIAKIPFTVIGNTASMFDFEDYYNTDNEIGNSITTWAEEVKGDIEGATKIYKSNDNTLGSREWWMNNGKGLIDSAGGFVISGGLLGKGVQILSNLAKGSKIIQGLGVVSNATMLNQAESIPIAMDVYKTSLDIANKQLASKIQSGELTQEEADKEAIKIAADAAAYSININRINIPLNLTSIGAFLRPIAATRQVAKDFSRKEVLTNLIKEGSQEYLEEDINMIAEKEAVRKATEGNKYAYNFDKTVDDVLSKEGFEQGIVGFLGGIAQTGGTELLQSFQKDSPSYDIDGNVVTNAEGFAVKVTPAQSQREKFAAQQKSLSNIELLSKTEGVPSLKQVLDKVKTVSTILNDIQEASFNNDDITVNKLKNDLLVNQALDAFKNGTTEQLINSYKSIQRDPTSKDKYGDDFMSKANEAIKQIEQLEEVYTKYDGLPQKNEIFNNRAEHFYNLKEAESLQKDLLQAEIAFKRESEVSGYTTLAKIKTLSTHQDLLTIQDRMNVIRNNFNEINNNFNKIITKEYTDKLNKIKEEHDKEVEEQTINTFADKIAKGEQPTTEEDIAYYEENKEVVDKKVELLKKQEVVKPTDIIDILNQQDQNDTEVINAKNQIENDPTVLNKEEVLETINLTDEANTLENNKQLEKVIETQENKENTVLNNTDGVMPELEVRDINNIKEDIQEQVSLVNSETGNTVSPQGNIMQQGMLIVPAAHSIARLDKEYAVGEDGKKYDISETLTEDMLEPMLLSNTQYQVGDTLILEVDTAFNIIKEDKTTITYDQLKDNPYLVPIKISNTEGKIIGYIHTLDWITSDNVADRDNNVELQRKLIKELREDIVANGAKSISITNKTFGKLNTTVKNENKNTAESIKNPDTKFVIGKDNQFFEGIDSPMTGNQPVNKKIVAGLTYMIVDTPVKGKTVALPIFNNKVDETIANTLMNAVEAYFTQNKKIADDIYKQLGIDILTNDGLRALFNLFVNTSSFTQQDLNNNTNNDNKLFLNISSNTIQYGIGGEFKRSVGDLASFNKAEFTNYIKKAYVSTFLKHLNKPTFKYPIINNQTNVEYVETTYPKFIKSNSTTNVVDIKLPDGSYTAFVQPVITFNGKQEQEIKDNNIFGDVLNETNPNSTDSNISNDLGEISFDDIDTDYLPSNIDQLPPKLDTTQTDNISKDSLLINGFNAFKQSEIINIMNGYMLKGLKNKTQPTYSKLKEQFEDLRNQASKVNSKKAIYLTEEFNKLLAQYPKFVAQSIARLKLFQVVETEIPGILAINDVESNNEKENFDDGASLQIDSKDSMSSRLKQFLGFVPAIKKSYLGLETYMPYDEVVNYLSGQLAGLEASYEDISTILEELIPTTPWVATVKYQLDNASNNIKNEFVQWATKHYVNDKVVEIFGSTKKGMSVKVMDSDQNAVTKIIISQWLTNLKLSTLVKEKNPGELIIDNTRRKELVEEIKIIDKNDLQAIREWLSKIGIDISPEVLEDLKTNKRKPFEQQFTEADGVFKNIIDILSIDTIEDSDTFESNNPLMNNSGVRKLAELQAKYTQSTFSNSHKNGEGKTIYSYSSNKYFINQFYKLKRNTAGYVSNLVKTSFASTSEWGKQLSNPNSYFSQVFNYFYLDTLKFNKNNTTLANMSPREHEMTKLGMFWNQNKGSEERGLISHFFMPTMSDKSTMVGLTALRHNIGIVFDEKGNITLGNDTKEALYNVAEAEYKRIIASYTTPNDIDGYVPGRFYFFKELNNDNRFPIWSLVVGEDGKTEKVLQPLNADNQQIIKDAVETHIVDLVKAKKKEWEKLGLTVNNEFKLVDKTYLAAIKNGKLRFANQNNNDITTFLAADFVINSVIANANMFQLISGDPALFFKKNYDETWINIGKRLAAEIAPGLELADSKNNKYNQAFIKDAWGKLSISTNYDQIERLLGAELAEPYRKIEGTDAQEYTTLKEHLYVLEKSGKITNDQALSLLEKEEAGTLNKSDYSIIFQPMKPVHVSTVLTPSMDANRKIYIKSSSFPLVKGLSPDMDKLRAHMLNPKNNIDRLAFKTATKVGGPKEYVDIFNQDGTIKDDIEFNNTLTLDRSGFKIQQEVPFDIEKEAINLGTQNSKLLFANILGVEGFNYEGTSLSGRVLKAKYDNLYKELFSNARKALLDELLVSGILDLNKVQNMLIEEATGRGWPKNDIDALKLVNNDKQGLEQVFALPLWSSTSSSKIEALLNSLVDNRVRKQKFRGNSFVLGSEEGFRGKSNDVIYTSSYNPNTGLLPQRLDEKTGEVLPAQVMITNKLKDGKGIPINLEKFIGADGLLNLDKLDPEILKIFGFRIPTQGHNSMSYVEIVGFLPQYMGDLIIAPKDWTKQMGSDFDVDKLYSYFYNTKYNESGKLVKDNTSDKKRLQNSILDIHMSVMSNPTILSSILNPLGFGELPVLAERITKARNKRLFNVQFRPTNLSDTYQRNKYMNARSGKSGTGIKSLDSVFTAITQERDLYLRTINGEEENPLYLTFGNEQGVLLERNNISNNDSTSGKTKLDTVGAYQSASVDNEKEQLLEKINSNDYTFDAERAFAGVGFDENYIVPLTAQDILFEYVEEMSAAQDSINTDYISRPEELIIEKLITKYADMGGITPEALRTIEDADYPLTQKEMWDSIENGDKDPNYYKTQIRVISKFNKAREIGKEISSVQLSVNTDSSGISPSLIESNAKEEKVNRLASNKYIANAVNLLDNTINGFATEDALKLANNLWYKLFPYGKENVKYIFDEVQKITGKEVLTNDQRYAIFNSMKSFIYTKQDLGLENETMNTVREKLFFDKNDNKSLASQVRELKKTSKNPFITRLIVEPDMTGTKPSLIKYNAGAGENFDELSVYQGFIDLIVNPDTRELAQNMVTYFYLSGGIQQAIQFGKYIPNAYLTNIDFAKNLREVDFNNEAIMGINMTKNNYYDVSNFTKQYIQHNPGQAIRLKEDLSQIRNVTRDSKKVVTSFTIDGKVNKELLVARQMPSNETLQVLPEFLNLDFKLYQYIGSNKYIQIDTLGTFGYTEYDLNRTNVNTMILENKANAILPNTLNTIPKTDTRDVVEKQVEDVTNNQPVIDRVKQYDAFNINNSLDIISKDSTNKLHRVLADVIKKNIGVLPKFNITKEKTRGSYDYNTKTFNINPNEISSDEEFERTILHELIHHITGDIIRNPKNDEQKRIVKSLQGLQDALLKQINANPIWKSEYEKFVSDYKAKNGLDDMQISKNYGALKLTEFVTMAMTDLEFQKILNEIPFNKDKSLLDRFVELVKSILNTIGFEINKGSVLEHAVDNIVELMNLTNPDYINGILDSRIKYTLPNGKIITFNEEQSAAVKDVNNWLQGSELFYTLSGFAGTGKTTIIKSIIDEYKGRVAVSAPTHKAKKVIRNTTEKDAFTIQALLGLMPNVDLENFDINKPQFDPKALKQIDRYNLIILDESSMLNKDLFELLIKEAKKSNTKIIFMGDNAQLPPVGESMSQVFKSNEINKTSNLTIVERQKSGNPLLEIYDNIRNNISSTGDQFIHQTMINNEGKGIEFYNGSKDFENKAIELFNSKDFKENKDFVKILTWTNSDVKYFNGIIRDSIFGKKANILEKGDLLMAYNNIGSKENTAIENSADYEVTDITETVNSYGLEGYSVSLMLTDEELISYVFILKPSQANYNKFLQIFNEKLQNAKIKKGRAWIEYFSFKNENLLMEDLKSASGTLIVKKDMDYGYAITIHKSQGSTYNNVMINENSIDKNINSEERNKLKYVALSRPSDKAYVLSDKSLEDSKINSNLVDVREYTPEIITKLNDNEVFVFGSNGEGVHGKGAALMAKQKFGAIQGKAKGRQGQSYAVITKKNWRISKSSSLDEIYQELIDFNDHAKIYPEFKFYVTKLGSSLAGYTINEIKELFQFIKENYGIPNNIILPKEYEVRSVEDQLPTTELPTIKPC